MYDVVAVGETMLRLSPPHHERLRRARILDLQICGSQGNVAANLARLGHRAAWISKLPDSALGLCVRDFYASCGVNVSHVRTVPDSRVGVFYVEFGATPRPSSAIFDRRGSAASTMSPGEFDWDAILAGTRVAHTDGILPGLSDTCRGVAAEFIAAARRHRCLVSFDVNYRGHLWSPQAAAESLAPLISQVDLLMVSRGDARAVFGCDGPGEQIARQLHEGFGCRTVGVAQGEVLSVLRGTIETVLFHEGQTVVSRRYEVDSVDRFGVGDAMTAGVIHGLLEGRELPYVADFSAALGALAFTAPGDVAHVTVAEVEAIMAARSYHVRR